MARGLTSLLSCQLLSGYVTSPQSDMKRCKAAPKSHSNLRSKNNSKYSNFSQVSAELLSPARWESNQEWNLIGASPAQWQSAKHNGNSQEVFLSNCSFQIRPPVAVEELKGWEFGTAWSGERMQLRRRKATCSPKEKLRIWWLRAQLCYASQGEKNLHLSTFSGSKEDSATMVPACGAVTDKSPAVRGKSRIIESGWRSKGSEASSHSTNHSKVIARDGKIPARLN